jgi:PST family polysaccharide transporter
LKKFNNYINSNVLFNVANLNSFILGVRIIAGILTSKFIAIFIGAEGLALVGNLSSFLKAIQSFSALGLLVVLYFTRKVVLTLVFSEEFLPARR